MTLMGVAEFSPCWELQTMDASDICWEALAGEFEGEYGEGEEERHGNGEYDLDTFRLAVAIRQNFSRFHFHI